MNKIDRMKNLKEERKLWEQVLNETLNYSDKQNASRMIQEIDREIAELNKLEQAERAVA